MSIYLTSMKNYFEQSEFSIPKQGNRALVLISGATSGSQEGFAALDILRENNISLIAIASNSALKTYGINNLISIGKFSSIYTEENFCNVDIIKSVCLVYLPVISANLVGKLANGIYDELLATLVFHAQMIGITIIGTNDGASPCSEDFLRRGYNNPTAGLVSRLKNNLNELLIQEIKLYKAIEIANELRKIVGCCLTKKTLQQKTKVENINKRIITQNDLQNFNNTTIKLIKNAILTDLAKEYAVLNNIILED